MQSESESSTRQHEDHEGQWERHSNGHMQHVPSASMSSDQQAHMQDGNGAVTPGMPFSAGQAAALSALLFEKQDQVGTFCLSLITPLPTPLMLAGGYT